MRSADWLQAIQRWPLAVAGREIFEDSKAFAVIAWHPQPVNLWFISSSLPGAGSTADSAA